MTEERKAPEEPAPPTEPRDEVASPEAPAEGPREGAVASPEATIEQLRAEVERYREEADHHWQQFLHAAADLENYKKQAARAREEAVARARRELLAVILGAVDNLERARAYAREAAARAASPEGDVTAALAGLQEGLEITHRQILELLERFGVRPFAAAGRPFDPRLHEAIEAVPPDEAHPAGTVVEEVERGYLIGEDVLRPARVRVARAGDGA